jgi:gamma interferon inducible lysosomal thiol reductase (GILT)
MHGPEECAGNVQQLCVAKHMPLRTWWEFVMCQNYQGKDHIGSSDVALKCARTHSIDWGDSEFERCAGLDGNGTGEEGVQLLHDSIHVAESLEIWRVSYLLPPLALLILNPTTGRAALSLSTERRFVFTTEPGNVVMSVIILNLIMKLELIQK